MPEILPGNGIASTLNGAISTSDVTIQIQSADVADFPGGANSPETGTYRVNVFNDPFNGPWEIMTVTGGHGTPNLAVTRACEPYRGTQAPHGWAAGTHVVPVLTKGSLQAGVGVPDPLSISDLEIIDLATGTEIGGVDGLYFPAAGGDPESGSVFLRSIIGANIFLQLSSNGRATFDAPLYVPELHITGGTLTTMVALEVSSLHATGGATFDGGLTTPGINITTPPEVTGSRTDGTALTSLLTALAGLGLLVDSSTP